MNQAEKTKQSVNEILLASMPEFARKGFDGASLNEICRKNGISKGKLFHHFSSKRELYLACNTKAIDDFISCTSSFEPKRGETFRNNLHDYFNQRYLFLQKNLYCFQLLLNVQKCEIDEFSVEFSELCRKSIKSNIDALKRVFDLSSDSPPEKTFPAIVDAFYISQAFTLSKGITEQISAMSEQMLLNSLRQFSDIMEIIFDVVLYGIYPRDELTDEHLSRLAGKQELMNLFINIPSDLL